MSKNLVRITESDLHKMVREVVERILAEDGEGAAMSGSFNGATNANISANAMYDVPFGGGVQRRKIYSPKGDKVSKDMDKVDMEPALKRKDGKGGSISIPKNRK